MSDSTTAPPQLALLADLALPAGARNRAQSMKQVNAALATVNSHVAGISPLAADRDGVVSGIYAAPHLGFEAAIQLRLQLTGLVEVRIGLGWGTAGAGSKAGASAAARSGSARRRALEALAALGRATGQARRPAGWRTFFIGDDPTLDDAFVAWLVCRDELAGRMDRRDASITLGLLRGLSQQEIGRQLGIAQSAVASRLKRNGAYAVLVSRERLEAIAGGEQWPGGSAEPAGREDDPRAGSLKPGTAPGEAGSKPGRKA